MTDSEDILEESRETLDYLHQNNSEKDSGGLPTAGYLNYLTKRRPDTETPLKTKSISFRKIKSSTSHKLDIDVTDRHELVRKCDVKALIQDKIQQFESEHEEIIECEEENHDHEIEEPMVIGRRQGLEVLLEELEK